MIRRGAAFLAAAAAAALPAVLLPVSNPDLFWHLSAARRMWETAAIPAADWLSWTMNGAPWADFEWLSQAAFGGAFAAAGLAGVWALKALLLALAAWRIDAWLRLYEPPDELRAAALAAWAAAMLPRADARPELFSILLFIETFRRLESWRLSGQRPTRPLAFLGFALWANLHAGFAYGLALTALYVAFGLPWTIGACALAGTLLQPAGWNVYRVLASHAADAAALSGWILEWKPVDPRNPWRWGELALVLLAAAALSRALRRKPRPHPAPVLALAALTFSGFRHTRFAAYAVTAAAPLAVCWLRASSTRRTRLAAAGAIAAFGLWALWCAWGYGTFRRLFEDRFAPIEAARFLESEKGTLRDRPLYNPWGWGGYLGWAIGGDYPVFQDGRYIFHGLLLESAKAADNPESWQSFLVTQGVEIALLENLRWMIPSTRRYRDGSERSIPRPYYTVYMPKDRWALVHSDDKALVFVRRDAIPTPWIASHEIRYLRPFDDEALSDAIRTGDVKPSDVEQERARLSRR